MSEGLGVLVKQLSSNSETTNAIKASIGKTIDYARIHEEKRLELQFFDGTTLLVWDGGQSCCETRYMRTDDDLPWLQGSELLGLEVRDAPVSEGEYGDTHEIQFLIVKTTKGDVTIANHNEHNGYYGGFYLEAFSRAMNWFEKTGTPDDGKPVHLAIRNPETGDIGSAYTPREETRKACRGTWEDSHVTLLPELVTCSDCLAHIASHGAEKF
jgi:hypothetical protein